VQLLAYLEFPLKGKIMSRMRWLLIPVLTILLFSSAIADEGAIGTGSTGGSAGPTGPLWITEEDNSPDTWPWKLKFPNGSLTDNGDGTTSADFGGLYLKLDQTTPQTITGGAPNFSSAIDFTQIATPANPPAGSNRLYFKNDDKLYQLTSGGSESLVGGGGGSSVSFGSAGQIPYTNATTDDFSYGTGLSWNPATSTLTATNITGDLTGNVTGNVSGNASTATSASSAASATNAANTAITDDTTTNAIMYPTWVTANTGNLPQKVSSTKLSFNPSSGLLTATGFSGPLTGNVTGNVSGNAGTVTNGVYTTDAGTVFLAPNGDGQNLSNVIHSESDPLSATKALDNIASCAINTSLLSDTADTDSLGSADKEWLNLYIGDAGKIYLGLGQDTSIHRSGANEMTLTASSGVKATNFISTASLGTSPYACTSNTLNTNLNADLLDGQHGTYYAVATDYLKLDQSTPQTVTGGAPNFSGGLDSGSSVNITGSADTVQLKVKANNPQVNDILQVLASDGTTKQFAIDGSGNLLFKTGQDIRPTSDSTTAINIAQADGTDWVTFDTTNKKIGINTTPTYKIDLRSDGVDVDSDFSISNSDYSHFIRLFPGRQSDPNPFILWKNGDPMRFVNDSGGWNELGRFSASGNLLVGTTDDDGTPATGKLVVKGSTNDGSTNIFVGRDSDEANVATLDTNGKMSLTSDAVAVKPTATIVIASSTSRGKDAADYVCDGTNDEVQIQAAIDALGVEGGTICLLEGTYTIAAVITIDKRITITGQQSGDKGGGTKLVLANAADCDMFDLVPAVGASTTHYQLTRFEHLMLDGNKANQTVATKAIDQNEGSAVDLTLYDIWFDSWKGYCIDLQQYWDWHIFRCVFEHNDTYAIHLEHVNSHAPTTGWIKDCFYPSVIQDGTDRSTRLIIEGNYINTSDAFNNFDLWCSNLIFKSNMTDASAAVRTANTYTILKINSTTGGTNTNNYVISDNIFNETGDKYAIDIGGGGTTIINRMVIEGNVFQFSDGTSIIHNTGTGQLANFIVSGNTFQGQDDNSMKGVYVGNSNVSNISDNTFINFATGVDISDASCYNPIVSGNNFDACTTPVTAGGSGTYNPLVYGNKTGKTKDFIVPDAGKLQANSLGDDKNIQVYHNDTSGQIVTSSGNLILAPNGTTVTVYPKILDVDTIQNYNDIVLKTYDGDSYNAALTVHGAGGTQTIQMNAYGAGALTTDASGNIVATSDERQKDIQGNFTRGLKDLKDISPIFYKWKPETGYDTEHVYAGLSAQNVQKNIPEAVMANEEGYLGLQDRPIIATLINAINEQQKEIDTLKARLDKLEQATK